MIDPYKKPQSMANCNENEKWVQVFTSFCVFQVYGLLNECFRFYGFDMFIGALCGSKVNECDKHGLVSSNVNAK